MYDKFKKLLLSTLCIRYACFSACPVGTPATCVVKYLFPAAIIIIVVKLSKYLDFFLRMERARITLRLHVLMDTVDNMFLAHLSSCLTSFFFLCVGIFITREGNFLLFCFLARFGSQLTLLPICYGSTYKAGFMIRRID